MIILPHSMNLYAVATKPIFTQEDIDSLKTGDCVRFSSFGDINAPACRAYLISTKQSHMDFIGLAPPRTQMIYRLGVTRSDLLPTQGGSLTLRQRSTYSCEEISREENPCQYESYLRDLQSFLEEASK